MKIKISVLKLVLIGDIFQVQLLVSDSDVKSYKQIKDDLG